MRAGKHSLYFCRDKRKTSQNTERDAAPYFDVGVFGVILKRSIKDTFSLIVLLYDQKYQKSFKRAFLPLKNLLPRARVSRASHAWQVRAANGKAKVGGFALRAISSIPRVRT